MDFEFSKLIREIESELQLQYMGGAIQWCDENFDGAWSKAIDRFDSALSLAIERKDHRSVQLEGEFYKKTILDLISKYKSHKKMEDADSFLKSLSSGSREWLVGCGQGVK